ncbi:carbohydrate ABC transporter permease [Paenibacillus nasutitermitis]|uniref:Sugar ABC transporter permease n=1 Tax=Paenibacillus nasutitermitis TaxID=1652958 RepID=A0A916Z2T1_9BACL|nr:carbohydrate ABC transporter permease [Paenibacillus nasutitermitis]GGD73519.1 sugar ABC transporter permease [Paenibacillus nasutitermitis]
MNNSFRHESIPDKWFTVVNYTVLTLLFLIILYPLIFIVSASFSDSSAVISGEVWLWPVRPTLDGYSAVAQYSQVWTGLRNSIIYTVIGTLVNVIVTILAAYPLSRKDFYGKNLFMILFMFTTMFTGGLIPTYLVVKQLGMLDSIWAMVIPSAMSVWNVIITRTYFQMTVPDELLEAAQLDGCSDFKFLWKIVLRISGPIIAVIALYYAAANWNQYFNAMIYLKHQSLYPLQLVLKDILISNDVDSGMLSGDPEDAARREAMRVLLKYSLIVISSIPLLVLYPFVQKYFVKGVMVGSLKG